MMRYSPSDISRKTVLWYPDDRFSVDIGHCEQKTWFTETGLNFEPAYLCSANQSGKYMAVSFRIFRASGSEGDRGLRFFVTFPLDNRNFGGDHLFISDKCPFQTRQRGMGSGGK
jgi:hypothetical protein